MSLESINGASIKVEDDEIITEVVFMEMLPVVVYDHYAIMGKKLFGIDKKSFVELKCPNKDGGEVAFRSVFIDNGTLYFTISEWVLNEESGNNEEVVRYFAQIGDVLTEIEASDFPESPAVSDYPYVVLPASGNSPWKIEASEYNGMDISRIYQGALVMAFAQIDGYMIFDGGILFSVTSDLAPTRKAGIWVWEESVGGPVRIKDQGRIY